MSHIKLVVCGHDTFSGDVFNTWNFNSTAGASSLANSLINDVYVGMAAFQHNSFYIDKCIAYTWTGPADGCWFEVVDGKNKPKKAPPWGVGIDVVTAAMPVAGSDTGDGLPAQCAPYIYIKTGVPRDIGKKYFGSIAESAQNSGNPTTLFGAYLTTVAEYIAAATNGLEIWGPIHGFQPIASAGVGYVFGTQRRRKRLVGK